MKYWKGLISSVALARGSAAAVALFAFAEFSPLCAETLKEALTSAYLFNPTLKAARAQLRATDNQVSQAKSGFRPRVTGSLQYGFEDRRARTKTGSGYLGIYPDAGSAAAGGAGATPVPLSALSSQSGTFNPRSASVGLQQNVFDGFRTYNAVRGAEAAVEAGREDLRSTEETMLLNTVTAYMNVVRDQSIVNVRQNNINVLREQLRATEDRFKVGEVTRTEVSQAQAALALAEGDLAIAQATLSADRAAYAQLVGHPPGTLKDPGPAYALLPKTFDKAVAIAQAQSPLVLAAIFRERAQAHQVKQIKGELLPNVSLNASYTKGAQTESPSITELDDTRVTGTVNIPIYEGGEVSARIRQAIEMQSALRQQIDARREQVRANVTTAWGQFQSAKGTTAAGKAQVASTKLALDGIREEQRVGQRTILDVLNAEQQYLAAQVNLISFQRDLVVASYSLLAAMGRLSAHDIALHAELYDPTKYHDEVKDAWYGWGASVDTAEDPQVNGVHAKEGKQLPYNGGPAYGSSGHRR